MSKILNKLLAGQTLRRSQRSVRPSPVKKRRPAKISAELADVGEFGLIDLLQQNIKLSQHVITGIGEDCAVIHFSSTEVLLFTTDMLIEDVHFTRAMDPQAIGYKALACNLSDIAAMGGYPTWAVISLGLPVDLRISFVKDIYRGINQLARKYNVAIVGGDTNKSEKIIINIALLGKAKKDRVIERRGAQSGDVIFVTGPLGGSFKTGKHLSFTPRLKEAQWLVKHFKPTAMIDISDGLLADLNHILKVSRVGAILEEEKIPLNKDVSLKEALTDGEDFELLFTLSPKHAERLMRTKQNSLRWYPIGTITPRRNTITLKTLEGPCVELAATGFKHF